MSKTSRVISSKARNLAMLALGSSKKSRESSVPMNMPHTDLTNLTKASRFALAVGCAECTRRMVAASLLRCSFCEICEICVRHNSQDLDFRVFRAICVSQNPPCGPASAAAGGTRSWRGGCSGRTCGRPQGAWWWCRCRGRTYHGARSRGRWYSIRGVPCTRGRWLNGKA